MAELLEGARAEMARVAEHGGAVEAVPYMKAALVESHRERIAPHRGRRAGRRRRQPVHGDRAVAADRGRRGRDPRRRPRRSRPSSSAALEAVARVARPGRRRRGAGGAAPAWPQTDENIMPATIAAARAGATTGEWAQALRDAFGSYRAPTGVGEAAAPRAGRRDRGAARRGRRACREALGRSLKILVGKPGLDGHSNGAEQIAVARARRRHGGRLRGHPPDAVADRRARRCRRAST